jgi:predicted transcriptional regulator
MTLVGAAIRRRRSRARLSQWELARLVGIDQSTISRVEGGDRGLRWSTFAKLVEQLGGLDFHD